MISRYSLRLRITLLAAVLVAVVLSSTSAAVVVLLRVQLLHNVDAALELRADQIGTSNDAAAFESTAGDFFAQLVVDGQVVVSSLNASGLAPLAPKPKSLSDIETVSVLPLEDDSYRILTRQIAAASPDGYLIVGENIDDLTDVQRALTFTFVGLVPILTGALAFVVWVLVGRTLSPVERIRAQVASLGADQLDVRVEEPQSADEIARLAMTMNQMLQRLEQASKQQRQFISDASHELRSPITRMRTELEVEFAADTDQDFRSAAASALEEVISLQRLVEDLLFLARSDETPASVPTDPVDLSSIIGEQVQLVGATSNVKVSTSLLAEAITTGSQSQLARMVRNLVENAVRYAAASVTVELADSGERWCLVVDDDGVGIREQHRESVFQRFTRVDEARTSHDGGTGLGLAIVKEIVNRHHGDVWVERAPGGGARLIVTLPKA